MSEEEFSAPAEVKGFDYESAKGHLLLIAPTKLEEGVSTAFGSSDASRADIHNISTGETSEDTLIFPKVLVGALKSRIGQKVLGKLGQGIAKPSQSPPWTLEDASGNPKAVAAARKYLATRVKTAPVAEVESFDDDDKIPF
jgi:hypothetical protein